MQPVSGTQQHDPQQQQRQGGVLHPGRRHDHRETGRLPHHPGTVRVRPQAQRRKKRRRRRAVIHGATRTIAESFRAQGNLDQAMANYHAAIRIDGEFALAHAGLGLSLFQARRYAAAIEAMERALELDLELPDPGSLHVLIGRSRQELGDWLAALQWYERALRIDPLNPQALDLLAMAYVREQRYEDIGIPEPCFTTRTTSACSVYTAATTRETVALAPVRRFADAVRRDDGADGREQETATPNEEARQGYLRRVVPALAFPQVRSGARCGPS